MKSSRQKEGVMYATRLLLPTAMLLVAVTGCGSSARLTRTSSVDGLDEGFVTIPTYSSANRDEALKLIASHYPAGYAIIEEGEVVVQKPFMRTKIPAKQYRIKFRESEHDLPSPTPTNLPPDSAEHRPADEKP
jgi:hypothetical protein